MLMEICSSSAVNSIYNEGTNKSLHIYKTGFEILLKRNTTASQTTVDIPMVQLRDRLW
jgi:hypothetical protein